MTEKQQEIVDLLIATFQGLKLNDLKHRSKISETFNQLSSGDHEWFQIEMNLFQIINNIEEIK